MEYGQLLGKSMWLAKRTVCWIRTRRPTTSAYYLPYSQERNTNVPYYLGHTGSQIYKGASRVTWDAASKQPLFYILTQRNPQSTSIRLSKHVLSRLCKWMKNSPGWPMDLFMHWSSAANTSWSLCRWMAHWPAWSAEQVSREKYWRHSTPWPSLVIVDSFLMSSIPIYQRDIWKVCQIVSFLLCGYKCIQ